jgi:uncharacterized protein Usg
MKFTNDDKVGTSTRTETNGEIIEWIGRRPILNGRNLTTAEILYYLPDHPAVLQSFVWQCMDRGPDFPRLHKFLDYWAHNLDGTLHSVRVMQSEGKRKFRAARYHRSLVAISNVPQSIN